MKRPTRLQAWWGAAVVVIGVTVVFVVLSVIAATRTPDQGGVAVRPGSSAVLAIGDVAPTNFDLDRLGGGQRLQLGSLIKGRPAVINLFVSWCPACAAELDAFADVSSALGSKVVFVGIDTNDPNPSAALALLKQAGVRYPVGIDTSQLAVATSYGVSDLPVTFFINARGRVTKEVLGKQSLAALTARVDALSASTR